MLEQPYLYSFIFLWVVVYELFLYFTLKQPSFIHLQRNFTIFKCLISF
jgi:hypothetical protein